MQFTSKNPHKQLSDTELLSQTLRAAKTENAATLALLEYLVEVDSRMLYATVDKCSSLFDYLVKILGFSNPTASERVNAVRLIRAVPPVKEHLETGELTLTSAAQIQRFVNAEQKAHEKGRAVSSEEKAKVVDACLGKSVREVEKTLFEKHSEPARILTKEKIRTVTATRSEVKFTVDEETLEKLKQLKNLTGQSSLEKIFDQALDALLFNEKKKRGVIQIKGRVSKSSANTNAKVKVSKGGSIASAHITAANADATVSDANAAQGRAPDLSHSSSRTDRTQAQLNSRFIPIDLKRFVFARSQGQCEDIDPRTKNRCQSRFRLQIDHILPMAGGGKTEASNLRHLCFAHNLRMAMKAGLRRPDHVSRH